MQPTAPDDAHWMRLALRLAEQGRGRVEPNPMVGCVIVKDGRVLGQGFHEQFGEPHAEVNALSSVVGSAAAGSTIYVTLEPCCHHGKTPPCTEALLRARPDRVVVAMADPFPKVDGGGLQILREAGISVTVDVCEEEARHLNAPYLKRIGKGQPWIIAKWAMTLDGKMATANGSSKWISSEEARREVHRVRGLVDAVMVGSGTARLDDPLLTARPAGPRTPARIVVDSNASLNVTSRLVETISEAPVLVAAASTARPERLDRLHHAGCELVLCPGENHAERMEFLLRELGRRGLTNVLVEGGSQLLGLLWDMQQIDEVHTFVAPKIIGGQNALTPVGGSGIGSMEHAVQLNSCEIVELGSTILVRGRTDSSRQQGHSS